MSEKMKLKLYIRGDSPQAEKAEANIRRLWERSGPDGCELEVIDIVKRPYLAEREKVLALPLLVRDAPPPRKRLVGDLSDEDKVLAFLSISRA